MMERPKFRRKRKLPPQETPVSSVEDDLRPVAPLETRAERLARRKAEEAAAARAAQEADERRIAEKHAAEEAMRAEKARLAEEARKRAEAEAERRREKARLKAEAEAAEAARRKAEKAAALKAAREAEERRAAEEAKRAEMARLAEEARRRAEEQARAEAAERRKAEEEAVRRKQEARRKAEEAARKQREALAREEEDAKKARAEAERAAAEKRAARIEAERLEAEALRIAQSEARRAEEAARRKVEAEAQAQARDAERERRKQDALGRKARLEAEAAEDAARRTAEAAADKARREAEEQARQKARQAEEAEAARLEAEAEARRRAEAAEAARIEAEGREAARKRREVDAAPLALTNPVAVTPIHPRRPATVVNTAPMMPPAEAPARLGPDAAWAALAEFPVDENHLTANRIVTATRDDPAHTAFDVLRTRLLQALAENGWKRVAITSPTKDCGKTFTAANLAISLSRQENCRTLLIDCDMRRPNLHKVMGVRAPGPIGDMLRGKVSPQDHLMRIGKNRIYAGRNIAFGFNSVIEPYASELLQDPRTARTLDAIQSAYEPDVMLFDLPPALFYDDVIAFRPLFDGVLLVIGGGITTEKEVKEVERRLGDSTPLLGMVLNKAESTELKRYQY